MIAECNVELVVLAVLFKVFGDLRGEFPCRLEDEGARHARARAAFCSSMVSIGSTKAAVLPVPVCAIPRISRRASTCGMASVLNGRGSFVAGCADGSENFGG